MIISAKKEYVFEKDTVTPSCHASTVLPLDNGEILVAWFGGKHEKCDDVEILTAIRSKDGEWGEPVIVSEKDDVAHWNPVLYKRENGEIVLFYKYGRTIPDWYTKFIVSKDNGRTWSKPEELVKGDTRGGRGPVKNKCLRLSDGTLLAPASTEQKKWKCYIDRSTDDGKTWTACEYMEMPKHNSRLVGLIQPTLWESEPGKVHCFMRSNAGAIYRSNSSDNGLTWSKPRRTRLPNNNSGIDCAKDSKGRLWLIFNPVDENWGVRHPLLLSCSTDNGKTFNTVLNCEPGNGEFSYPAIVAQDNKIYITYTHKRKQIVFWEIVTED